MPIPARKLLLTALTALTLLVIGCDQGNIDADERLPAASVESSWDAALADSAGLIDVLPESTLAYVRIPTLWGLLAAPKAGALESALGSPANRDTVMALQARIPEVMEEEFGDFAPLISLLLSTLRSPLEIALVGEGPQPLWADLVIEARLAMESVDELNALLGQYSAPNSPFQQLQAASADQPGQLLVGLFTMFYDYDADTQRVRIVGGMSAGINTFEQAQSWTASSETALKAREQRVDDSGHGLMVWADGTRLMPALEQMASPDDLAELRELGVLGLKEFALAYGSQRGKARLSLIARGEEGPIWDFGLPAQTPSGVTVSGEADYIAGWVTPDFAWIESVWRALSPAAETQIKEANEMAVETTGIGLAGWVDAIAGRWTLIGDDSGTYMVHEPVAPEAWSTLIEGLSERFEVRQTETIHAGQRLRHLTIPGLSVPDMLPDADDMQEQVARFVMERMMAVGTHVHWMEDSQGRRVLAAVPQILRDRLALAGETRVDEWLNGAGVDQSTAAVFSAIEVADAPMRNYYSYLTLLQALGDILDTEVDLNGFPSAHELGLADHGSVGMELRYSDGTLGLGLVFENHPGDVMYSGAGGLTGIALVGILAAIAIPAYQDYAERARSSEFLLMAAGSKLAIAEFYATEGRLPNPDEAAGFSQTFDSGPVLRIDYDARLLRLVLQLGPEAGFGDGATLELVPVLQDGLVTRWRCTSPNIDEASLPAECRS
ncbi:hypothetical protein AY599_13485 [Leptolyngbya valderiana BDU 20041]|nr:hypothetical protein AY599_13485 [Leptolyngbya valderiana BDU 20041]